MKKIISLVLIAILLSSNIVNPSVAKKRKPVRPQAAQSELVSVCDKDESLYVPGELLVSMKEQDDLKFMARFLPKKTVHGMKMSRLKSKLKSKTKKHKILAMEDLYEPNFDSMDQSKAKLKKANKLSHYEKHLNERKLKFNTSMLESSVARTVILKSENKTCKSMEKLIKELSKDKDVEHIELNRIMQLRTLAQGTPNDPRFADQWYLTNTSVDDAWSISTGVGAFVGVLDGDLNVDHDDLRILNPSFFVQNPPGNDSNSEHGTWVTGVVGARGDNGIGITGVAPNSTIRFATKENFITNTGLRIGGLINAIDHQVNNDSDMINMSFGQYANSLITNEDLYKTVVNAIISGVTVITASGNDNVNVSRHTANIVDSDGQIICTGTSSAPCFDYFSVIPGVISVAATERNNSRSNFSNFGADIDIAAPGRDILTTGYTLDLPSGTFTSTYESQSGTSFSSPIVAGVAALMISRARALDVELSPSDIATILTATANTDAVTTDAGKPIARKVNANKALQDLNRYLAVPAPSNLRVTVTGDDISASWNSVSYARSGYEYEILRGSSRITLSTTNSTSASSSSLDAGDYIFRVRSHNIVTDSAWRETRFTIAPQSLGQVNISSPAHGEVLSNNRVRVQWNPVAGADSYEYSLSGPNATSSYISTGSDRFVDLDLNQGDHTIFVIALANSGARSQFTGSRSFAVDIPAPLAPSFISPAAGAILEPGSVEISWEAVPNAAFYRLNISGGNESGIFENVGGTTSITKNDLIPGDYSVRVIATNLEGENSPISSTSTRRFTIVDPTPSVTNLEVSFTGTTLNASWRGVNADEYIVTITDLFTGRQILFERLDNNVEVYNHTVSVGSRYRFEITPLNSSFGTTGDAVTSSILEAYSPLPVLEGRNRAEQARNFFLNLGDNDAVLEANNVDLTWRAVSGAVVYRVRLVNQDDNSTVNDTGYTITSTAYHYDGILSINANGYKAIVNYRSAIDPATGARETSPNIDRRFIVTAAVTDSNAAPAAPQIRYPQQSLVTTQREFLITWDAVARAASYRLILEYKASAAVENFTRLRDLNNLATNNAYLEDLPQGNYRLSVYANNSSGASSERIRGVNYITSFVIAEEATELPQTIDKTQIRVEATSSSSIELSWPSENSITAYNVRLRNITRVDGVREEIFVIYAPFNPNAIGSDGRYYYTIPASALTGGSTSFDNASFPAGIQASVRGRNSLGFGVYNSNKFKTVRL